MRVSHPGGYVLLRLYGLTGAIFTGMFYINNACEKFYVNDCDQNLTFSDAFFPKTFPKCQC